MMYDSLNSNNKEKFKSVCNKLLSCSTLTKYKESSRKDYYFLEENINGINEYLSPLGFEVELNKGFKSAILKNAFGTNKFRFNLVESIILLIIRVLYVEKMNEISLSENPIIEIMDIQNKLIALGFKNRNIEKSILKNVLNKFKRFNLIEQVDKTDIVLDDSRIEIYPTILMVIKTGDIEKLYEKLDAYKRKGVNDSEETYRD